MIQMKAIIALLAAGGLFLAGWQTNQWRWESKVEGARADQTKEVLDAEREQGEAVAKIDEKATKERAEIEREARVIEKEVIRYVEKDDDGSCPLLDADWVWIVDSAAGVPEAQSATSAADAGATPAPADRGLRIVTNNYIDCRQTIKQVIGLQEYVREIRGQRANER